MHKVSNELLEKLAKLLDKIANPSPDGKGDVANMLEAQALSKIIKDNYTQVET